MSLAIALLACGVSLLGTLLALKLRAQMQWLTAFSAGLLVAVAVVNLLPEAFSLEHETQSSDALHRALLYIAGIGFLLFYTLDLMVPEQHAHGHEHHRHAPEVPRVIGLIGAVMLSLHRFLDGALISAASSHLLSAIGAAIVIHNFADGLSSASIMLRDGHSLRRTFVTSVVVAVCPLLGWSLGGLLQLSPASISYALALFAGAFLYLGGSHLLIREHGNRLKYAPLAAAGGFILIYLLQN